VQQRFARPPNLTELAGLDLAISVRLIDVVRADIEGFDDAYHAAQFQMFLTIQNLTTTSPGYGDFFYFGIPLFDSRYRETELYARADTADPSGKFIYIPPSAEFLPVSTHDRTLVEVRCDVLPLVHAGIASAWEHGFLPGSSDLADYYVSGMNFGWEIPGTYDASILVRDLSLRAR
jgi:hypothetical protein